MFLGLFFDYDLDDTADALALSPGKRFLPTYRSLNQHQRSSFRNVVIYHGRRMLLS